MNARTASTVCLAALLVAGPVLADAEGRNPRLEAEVSAALDGWLAAVATRVPANVEKLYDPQAAVLLPTVSPVVHDTVEERAAYFQMFLGDRPNIKGTITEKHVRIFGARNDVGIASGLYTFTWTGKDGQTVTVPARYTFTFENERPPGGGPKRWMIVEHHSSVAP
jgi:hypothetical protein